MKIYIEYIGLYILVYKPNLCVCLCLWIQPSIINPAVTIPVWASCTVHTHTHTHILTHIHTYILHIHYENMFFIIHCLYAIKCLVSIKNNSTVSISRSISLWMIKKGNDLQLLAALKAVKNRIVWRHPLNLMANYTPAAPPAERHRKLPVGLRWCSGQPRW